MIPAHIPAAATSSASLLYGLIGIYIALASIGFLYWLDRRVRSRQEPRTLKQPTSIVHATDLAYTQRVERELGDVGESLTSLRSELVCWRDATTQSAADIKSMGHDLDAIMSRLDALESQAATNETASDDQAAPSVLSIFGHESDHEPNAAPDTAMRNDGQRGWVFDQAPETADDLTQIWGIGPSYEKRLQESGIYRFSQIAAWSDETIDYFDNLFSFKGRISRENWVDQASRMSQSKAA